MRVYEVVGLRGVPTSVIVLLPLLLLIDPFDSLMLLVLLLLPLGEASAPSR